MKQIAYRRISIQLARHLTILAAACLSSQRALAESIPERLERAIYLQEAKNDLERAIAIYREIVQAEQAERGTAAEAQYRLAVCYQETGRRAEAAAAFEKLVASFPEQDHWVEAALDRLPKAFAPSITPWQDGETLLYEWRLPSGQQMGFHVQRSARSRWEDQDLWRVTNRFWMNGQPFFTAVEFDPIAFRPAYSRTQTPVLPETRAWYDNEKNEVTLQVSGEDDPNRVAIPEGTFDTEQVVALMRQLPLDNSESTSVQVFYSPLKKTISTTLQIAERRVLDSILGSVECYAVTFDFLGQKQTAWFTSDDKRYPVKTTMGGLEAKLVHLEIAKQGEWTRYRNEPAAFAMERPSTWLPCVFSTKKNWVQAGFLDPEGNSEAAYNQRPLPEGKDKFIHGVPAWYSKRRDDLDNKNAVTVVGGSPDTDNAYDKPYLLFDIARPNGMTSRAIEVFVTDGKRIGWLNAATARDEFEDRLPLFKRMAASLELL